MTLTIDQPNTIIHGHQFESNEDIEHLIISSSNVLVMTAAFKNCKNLKDVVFSSSIFQSIVCSHFSFFGCDSIKSIYVPKNTHLYLSDNSFCNCKGLENFKSNGHLQLTGESNFEKCSQLETVKLAHCAFIPNRSFAYCCNLKSFEFSDNLQTIGEYAFQKCKKLSGHLVFPSTLECLGRGAFTRCFSLTNVDLSNTNVRNIPASAFSYCVKLNEIKMPKDISVDKSAFDNCCYLRI